MNYWYRARSNEIFLDLDSRRSLNRAINVLRIAVLDRSKTPKLPIENIYLYPSQTEGHAHVIIQLKGPLGVMNEAWSAWLGNDRLRLAYVLARWGQMIGGGDLLVSRRQYYRAADAVCSCQGKHKDSKTTDECPAMIKLLGSQRSADYFYRTGPMRPLGKIRIPWGRVSKRQLKEWSNGKRKK
jgi:hypothetical protein